MSVFDQFKILSTTTVFKSEKLRVDRAKISLPNGNIAEWDVNVLPSFYFAAPVKNGLVLMTKEWRLGPNRPLTQFTAARCVYENESENLAELKRELCEELGLIGGTFTPLVTYAWGFRTTGDVTYFAVEDYSLGKTARDENEIQEIIRLPIKGLYRKLTTNHTATGGTLLAAKLLEEKFA